MTSLRPYQTAALEGVRGAYRGGARSVLLQLPTGAGKTRTASECIRSAVERGRRVVFAAHLGELLDDASERLNAAAITHGIVQADRPTNAAAPVQVASLATLQRRGETPPADFVIIDEAHHAAAAGVRAVLERYPRARLLGLTATPERGDGAPLGDVFERLVCGPSVRELTAEGHLVPAVVLSPPAPTEGALAMDPVEAYTTHASGSRALIFCTTVAEAEDVAARMPVPTQTVLGETPRDVRRKVRELVTSGELRVLVGCSAFLEGFDLPAIETVVLARTLGTCSAFLQAIGRGLRPSRETGKRGCLVLDLTGAAIMHGLPIDDRVWSLEGAAVRRTAEALQPLARCRVCFAVFHAGPTQCPRCGAASRGTRLPRRATRVERQDLARLDTTPQWERDARALRAMESRLLRSGKFKPHAVAKVALSMFQRAKKRAPEPRPEQAA
ncbi:MAG TPA: DEAD/DEAH box helicase [Polyangiaceae bacterium]|jgi:superfamily II DNA or RNA helicase